MPEPDNFIGNINIGTNYFSYLRNDFGSFDDNGSIFYNMAVNSGSGVNEINRLWHRNSTCPGSESFDLFNLSFNRLGLDCTQSFESQDNNSNIKGVIFFNQSSQNFGVKLPFHDHVGFNTIGPSGSMSFYAPKGYEIDSSGAIIQITGNGEYSIALIGTAPPKYVLSSHIISLETIGSSDYNSVLNNEFRGIPSFDFTLGTEHLLPFSTNSILLKENKFSPSSDHTVFYEQKSLIGFPKDVPFELRTAPSGFGHVLTNNKFIPVNTSTFHASSTPTWQFIFNTGHIVQMPRKNLSGFGSMSRVDFEDLFTYTNTEPTGNKYKNREIILGNTGSEESVVKLREAIKFRQKFRTEIGTTYNFQFDTDLIFDGSYRIGTKAPRFNLKKGSGTTYYERLFDDNYIGQISGQFTSLETSAIFEFEIPQHVTDTVNWQEEWSLTEQDYQDTINHWDIVWKVTNPSVTKA